MSDVVKIEFTKKESEDTRTIGFLLPGDAKAGQFVMVWIPGVDEIPMSLSSLGEIKTITVKAVGDATGALCKMKKGGMIGIRGPYGNGFSTNDKKILIVAGGSGIAALMPLIRGTGADTVIGARTEKEVIMAKEASGHSKNVWISTDDGSCGFRGNAVQLAKEKMKEKKYDAVAGCGPEIMLYHLHRACAEAGVECQLSLERYMKCGAGLCGSCLMDHARVCMDGPVFTGTQLNEMKAFGKTRLDASGRKAGL